MHVKGASGSRQTAMNDPGAQLQLSQMFLTWVKARPQHRELRALLIVIYCITCKPCMKIYIGGNVNKNLPTNFTNIFAMKKQKRILLNQFRAISTLQSTLHTAYNLHQGNIESRKNLEQLGSSLKQETFLSHGRQRN